MAGDGTIGKKIATVLRTQGRREEQSDYIEQLTLVNEELRQARRAALNMMEDAILSKEALRQSEEKYRTKLQQEVSDRTAELNATKENLQATLDSSLDVIQVFKAVRDNKGEITDFTWEMNNRKALELNGEVIGQSLLVKNPGIKSAGIFIKMVEVIETGKSREQEQYYNAGQLSGWFYQALVKSGDGLVMTTRDITEQKKAAEEILRLKDEIANHATDRYYRLFNSIDEGFCIVEVLYEHGQPVDYRILEANPAFFKHTGLENAIGKTMGQLVPGHEDFWALTYGEVVATGKAKRFEHFASGINGGVWYDVYASPSGEPGNNKVAVVFNDVTEQKSDAASLLESEAILKATMDSATDYAIITMDRNRRIQQWNSGAEKVFGYKPEEVIGDFADIIFTEEDRVAGVPQKEMESARNTGRAIDERWHVRKDGSRFYVSGVMTLIRDPALSGYVKVARDMTGPKLLQQRKEEFISVASHELKTPVTSIKIYAEALQEKLEESGSKEYFLLMQKLNKQVDRLINLIRDLLDTTKINAGEMIFRVEEFNINELLHERIEELQRLSKDHPIVMEEMETPLVTADKERIGQVIINIIANAIKYSPRGSQISVQVKAQLAGVVISIRDKGIGIPAHLKDKVFDRFYRVTSPAAQTYPGMGLGLYISQEIIHRHHGTISVETELGEGSVFQFFLPYHYKDEKQ